MVVVRRKKGDTDDKLIARFRKETVDSGVIEEIKAKSRYEKPSERRKKQRAEKKHRIMLDKRRNKRML